MNTVQPSLRSSIIFPYFQRITFYAPNFEEVGGAYCFWGVCACVRPCVHACVRPSVTLFDAQHNFWTVHARVLKFYIRILHEQIADVFFSHTDYAPFLSYGPFKKYGWNIISKISQKLLKLELWNLVNSIDWYWCVNDLINFWINSSWVMPFVTLGNFTLHTFLCIA